MDTPNLIRKAAAAVGTQAALASALGVSASIVWQWSNGRRPVPTEYCTAIERATGSAVTRRDLRPSDWWLIWPELVNGDHPAPLPASNSQEAA